MRSELTRAKSQNSTSTACWPSSRSIRRNATPSQSRRGGNSGAEISASAGGRTGAKDARAPIARRRASKCPSACYRLRRSAGPRLAESRKGGLPNIPSRSRRSNAKAVRIRGDRHRGPRFCRGRLRGEHLYGDGGKKPAGKGSKAKPLPIALNFSFGVGNTDSTLRGSPIQIYAIGSEGLVTYPKSFPTCTFAQANDARPSPRSARRRRPAAASCRRWSDRPAI